MKNNLKQNKGITLIALIITIIVMLILVAVTISMAINGGLFGYAGNAARQTENAKNAELELTNIRDNMTTDELIAQFSIPEPSNFSIGTEEYQYEPGMTWEAWCNSSYNVDGFYCYVWDYPNGTHVDGILSAYGDAVWDMSNRVGVLRTDTIDSEKTYQDRSM